MSLGDAAVVTAPTEPSAALVRDGLEALPMAAVTDADAVREVLPVAEVLGPATLSYVSPDAFLPAPPGPRLRGNSPVTTLHFETWRRPWARTTPGEAALGEITSPAFVMRVGGRVVAAAGYRSWPGRVAHLSVLTDPAWRGRGFARVAASAAVTHAFAAGLLPQWRARPLASRRVAAALGFRELGAQLSIKLAGCH
ncbi:GNAT family N-acetyltransferase [Streptomyces sp. NPDC002387]|uniref:GNAT family N-acetyltransferase n=1 Tax=Streptomyces sp. NPDC002387 TaxID=3364643 RepID=UPI0036940293